MSVADLIAFLEEACGVCGAAALSGAAAAGRLGTITDNLGPGLPVRFTPRAAVFASGEAVREPDVDECTHVLLRCADDARPPLSALADAFGKFSVLRNLHWDDPTRVLITVAQPAAACDCALIVALDGDEPAAAAAVSVMVRRDRHTG